MAVLNNIRIILANGQVLDYESETSLGIRLNRIVDDLTDVSKRFGEFSYTFKLPKTKNNTKIFEYPDAKGRTKIFRGKTFEARVYNNNDILQSGIIELVGVPEDGYSCKFYSSFTQLIDELKEKKLNELTTLPTIDWNYELSIIEHITVSPISEHIEFPFIFYRTPFISGATSPTFLPEVGTRQEANLSYVYNFNEAFLQFKNKNPFYEAAFPPAIYLTSVIDAIMEEAGWSISSSFFEREDIGRIIIPFTGKNEDFSGAVIDGITGDTLNLNRLLPDMNQADFLRAILQTFNLYIAVDVFNKNITIETYDVWFSDNSNPYPIDVFDYEKTDVETEIKLLTTADDTNNSPMVFNRIFDYNNIGHGNPTYNVNTGLDVRDFIGENRITRTYSKQVYDQLWNKLTGTKEIVIGLSPVNYYPYTIINDRSINGNTTTAEPYWTVGIPCISNQTVSDNQGQEFYESEGDYVEGNDPSKFSYEGGLKLLWYLGTAEYNYSPDGSTAYKDWQYVSIATGGTVTVPTSVKVPVCFSSPFKLVTTDEYQTLTGSTAANLTSAQRSDVEGFEIHGLMLTFMGAGTLNDLHVPTPFSLTFNENPVLPNIYTEFHQKKQLDYQQSYLIKGKMRMNSNDWRNMRINRPLIFNDEIFRLVSIKNYDPVLRIAEIEIMKKT